MATSVPLCQHTPIAPPYVAPGPPSRRGICQNQLTTNSFAMLVCHCHRFTAICHPNLMNIHRDPIDPPSFDPSFVHTRGLKNSRYRKSILCLFLSPPFFRYTVSRVWFQVLSVYKWVYIIQPRGMIEGCAIYGEDWIRGI